MPVAESIGAFVGAVALSGAAFVVVSYLQLKDRINEDLGAGRDPYQLRTSTPTTTKRFPPDIEGKRTRKGPVKKKSG